jgi:prepilin-type processing-associated H-X9-DG protein
MKPRRSSQQRNQALTLIEVLVILTVITLVAALLLPALASAERKAQRISCISFLKQIGLAYRVWAGDNFEQYPLWATGTNNGTAELLRKGVPDSQLVRWNFMTMSNELSTPIVLHCPSDDHTTPAYNFTNDFGNSNISYFVSLDASEDQPQMILSGDDNLIVNGAPVQSGVLNIPTNATAAWTNDRHPQGGNIGLADGSVGQITIAEQQQTLQQTGVATNRFAIP